MGCVPSKDKGESAPAVVKKDSPENHSGFPSKSAPVSSYKPATSFARRSRLSRWQPEKDDPSELDDVDVGKLEGKLGGEDTGGSDGFGYAYKPQQFMPQYPIMPKHGYMQSTIKPTNPMTNFWPVQPLPYGTAHWGPPHGMPQYADPQLSNLKYNALYEPDRGMWAQPAKTGIDYGGHPGRCRVRKIFRCCTFKIQTALFPVSGNCEKAITQLYVSRRTCT
eukprot:9496370-Pyramimonas_sp.AAC.1